MNNGLSHTVHTTKHALDHAFSLDQPLYTTEEGDEITRYDTISSNTPDPLEILISLEEHSND